MGTGDLSGLRRQPAGLGEIAERRAFCRCRQRPNPAAAPDQQRRRRRASSPRSRRARRRASLSSFPARPVLASRKLVARPVRVDAVTGPVERGCQARAAVELRRVATDRLPRTRRCRRCGGGPRVLPILLQPAHATSATRGSEPRERPRRVRRRGQQPGFVSVPISPATPFSPARRELARAEHVDGCLRSPRRVGEPEEDPPHRRARRAVQPA